MQTKKSIFKSKTMLVNGLVVIASFFPAVRDWMQAHPDLTMQGVALLNVGLRAITKDKVSLFGSDD